MPKRIHPTSAISKLKKLRTPEKIQDFLNSLPFNREKGGETYHSVEKTLEAHSAHCFEGALVAAAALSMHGHKPLLMDLRTAKGDDDHVVALFRRGKFWGAISKTNHAVLRYREPIYKSPRELAMSYFHEYFDKRRRKTLRKFSKPFDLSKTMFNWITGEESLIELVNALDRSQHEEILPRGHKLRKADKIEAKASEIEEYK